MRNKAKGVLGRMFGSSSVQQTVGLCDPPPRPRIADTAQSSPSPAGPSSHRPPPIPPSRPPVPAVPPAYMTMKDTPRSSMSSPPPSDVFRQVQPTSPPSNRTPALMASSSFASPEENGPVSVTPTRLRQPSDGSILSVDKALPPLRPIDDTSPIPPPTRSSASSSNRVSGHTRQAATTHEDDSSSPRSCQNPSPQPTARPSSPDPSQASPSFSDDIAGMFDGIGQSELARELGLPPDSLRSQGRRKSADSRRFPAELGRVDSMERRRSATKSVHLPLPVPNKRTSSLPGSTPQLDRSPRVSQGTVSSPDPSVESSLVPPPTVSRTSSSSSRRRAKTAGNDASYAALSAAPLGSPLLISNAVSGDFGPLSGSGEATLRAKPHGEDLRPLSPQSVSLIASPRPDSIQQTIFNPHTLITNPSTPSAFVNSSPWGAQSPTPASLTPGRMEDPLEFVSSPVTPYLENGEDDEERGRRLACDCLENDFSHVAADKVAEFLGGP